MSSDSPADDLYGKIWEASSKDDREEPEPLFPPPPTSPPPPPPTCEPPLPPPPASASTDVAVRSTLCSTRYLGAPSDHSQLPSCVSVVMDAESGDELEAGSDENIYSDLTLDEKMRITSISEEDYLREGFMQMQYGYRWIKRYLRLTNYELFIYAKQSSIVSKKILPLSKLLDVRVNKGKLELALSMDRPITLVFRAVDDSAEETYDEPPETVWQNCIYSRIISLNLPPGFLDEEELGWAKVVGRHKYLFALNRRRAYLAYYRSDEEFRAHVQTHRMSLRTCLIKPNPTKSGLDLISASVRLTLQFEDSQRLEKFRSLVESAIRTDWTGEESEPAAAAATDASAATNPVSQQLLQVNSNLSTSTSSLSLPVRHQRSASDSSAVTAAAAAAVMTAVLKNESNRVCGDCGAANPLWASLNLCVTLCDDCSGHHRKLSTDFSKVHGLKFDVKVWTDEVVQLFLQLGNGASNSFWCHKEQPRVALRQFATPQDRLNYIVRKYVRKAHADDTPPLEFANSKPLEAVMRAIHLSKLDSVQHLISDNSLEKKLVDLNRKAVGEVLLWDQCITSGEQLWLCLRSNGLLCLYKQEMSVKEKLDCSHLCFLQLSGSFLQLATEAASFQLAIKERLSAWWHQLCRHLLPGLPDETAANQYNMVLKVTVQMAEFGSEPLDCILAFGQRRMWVVTEGQLAPDPKLCFDLRHVQSYRQSNDQRCCVHLCLPRGPRQDAVNLRIVSPSPDHANELLRALESALISGQSLEDQPLDSKGLPLLASACLHFVANYGFETEGIYRLAGNQQRVAELLAEFKKSPLKFRLFYTQESDVHVATGLLKLFLRDLSDPPLPPRLTEKLVLANENPSQCAEHLRQLKKRRPVSYAFLRALILHTAVLIGYSQQNKMSLENMSLILGQSLRPSENAGEVMPISKLVQLMVRNRQQILNITDEEVDHEKSMYQQAKRIIDQQQQSTHQQQPPVAVADILIPVFIGEETDLSVNVRVASSTDARDIVRLACEKLTSRNLKADSCCLFETMETLASGSDHVTTSDQCETDTMESDVADELARVNQCTQMERLVDPRELVKPILNRWQAWASESSGMSYYATRMRFRLREYSASAWPVFYGQDNILVERKFYTNVRAEYCGPRTPASKLAGCLATLDGHELILTPSGGRLAALPGIQKLQSLGQGHMLSPVRLGLADHYLFYGADLRRLGRSDRGEKRCRAFTLMSLHEGLGGGGADVGGSGGFLGHTIVFPKKEEDQFKPFFTQAMRILDELGRSSV
ncbi:hypothetical protein BOX15_Mlig009126g1 [Macrostomum lignano]|uniref:Arf-GAP domain-containing protein n=1 Tax=Macrostomum lignano TaxID=282301 RepID=A0A267EZE3_9PLAT|nr:hypothetical protein BOX15_Mlig009126g1 [Macrostomum lignano]